MAQYGIKCIRLRQPIGELTSHYYHAEAFIPTERGWECWITAFHHDVKDKELAGKYPDINEAYAKCSSYPLDTDMTYAIEEL